ncbi:MAG: PEP-CTERM sorting domain-containing protein [Gammaproteobacteria bacterium]|nr:PEP-CTERM sorting domain-containing protein [Gammaproteobacteria bacterium]
MSNNLKIILNSALLLVASNVTALPITGTMEMGGSFYALDSEGNRTSNAGDATSIDFDFFGYDMFVVNTASGDFDGLAGQYGYIKDIQFEPFVAPVADFWSIGDFSFDLTELTRGFTENPDKFLVLSGAGTLSATGFDDTVATWSFSGDTTGTGVFSWSATSEVSVPEPNILFLLSIGLISIGLRKKL